MKKTVNKVTKNTLLCLLSFILLLGGCSSRPTDKLSEITVQKQGQSNIDNPRFIDSCQGFQVSPEQVENFYQFSSVIQVDKGSHIIENLPCYASGEAYLGEELLKWKLKSGGIGQFTSEDKDITKICGISCCDKVQGIC